MDTYSTGEELVLKARKPYTITKQRERWTEEEHNRFLEALKLYGRAWQRIEEHIGTKTAVQIRSHAQKFFSKLEKEAVVIGVQPGQTLDIDIPPPRPKRKPSYPYPRKSNTSSCTTSLPVEVKNGEVLKLASSMHCGKEIPEFKTELPSKTPVGIDNSARGKVLEEENCSEVIITSQTASCVSFISANRSSIPSPVVPKMILEFLPLTKEVPQNDDDIMADDIRKLEAESNHKIDGADPGFSDLDNSSMSEDLTLKISNHNPHEKLVMENSTENLKQTEKPGHVSTNEMQANQSYPEHVPVHTVGMSSGPDMNSSSSMYSLGAQGNPYLFIRPENSSNTSMSSVHQTLPPFLPPSATLPNNETCASFPNVSPTFPCLLMPSLLQDPAAHMAATLSASLQPNPNGETTVNSSAGPFGRFQPGQMSPTPNLAAIAAATVAAASAWWAAHGLLPLCSSSQTGLLYPPPFSATPMDIDQAPPVENSKLQDHSPESCPCGVQELGPEQSEATKRQPPGSKLFKISSSDSAKDGGTRSDSMKSKSAGEKQDKGSAPLIVLHDSVKSKFSKKVDRSSCGSNSCSSSEVETDALKTRKKVTGELEEPDVSSQDDELNIHCSDSTGTANESWKEVSQEGRSAFRALFRREILPQSFSPPPDPKNAIKDPKTINIEGNQYIDEKDEDILQLNLYCNSQGTNPNPNPNPPELLNSKNTEQLGFLSMGLGHGKFKSRRTGFKPYKRCSTEANEVRMANEVDQCEEKCPKRICIIGEPSTL